MSRFRVHVRRWSKRPKVRPFALFAPVVLLLIAAPLLRPLRHPGHPAPEESIRLQTVESIVETKSFAIRHNERARGESWIEGTVTLYRSAGPVVSGQPPFMASLLAGAYWVMHRYGLTMDDNPALVSYLLTLLGTTLPAAGAAGLIYRTGRMFELQRSWRTLLSVAAILGSGIGSYSTVLNPHVPAAAFVLGSAAAIIHWARSENPFRSITWLSLAGLCAAAGSVIDPLACVFLILFLAPVFALRVGFPTRLAGALLYVAGAAFPLVAHTSICLRVEIPVIPQPFVDAPEDVSYAGTETDSETTSRFAITLLRMLNASLGHHGFLVHFPILIVGCFGIAAVMHRHWPLWMKTLAAATGVGAWIIFFIVTLSNANLQYAMYSNRWFLCFSPLLMLWCGAWLKRGHSRGVRVCALICLVLSLLSGIIGMLRPWPPGGYEGFTMVDVFSRLYE